MILLDSLHAMTVNLSQDALKYLAEMFRLLKTLAKEDIYVRILLVLATQEQEYTSLRGLARSVNMSPKNLKKYVQKLASLGILRVEHPHEKMILISFDPKYRWLREAALALSGKVDGSDVTVASQL